MCKMIYFMDCQTTNIFIPQKIIVFKYEILSIKKTASKQLPYLF